MDKLKEFAETLGLTFESAALEELNECFVEGPTDKVIAFRNETGTYGTGWYDISDGVSCYCFCW